MLRKLTVLLGGALVGLARAVPPVEGGGPEKNNKPQTLSAQAVCMQSVAQSARTFHQQQVDARKAFEAQRKAAKKAFKVQEKAARQAFHQLHPNPTDAELKAFHDQ